MFQFDQTETFSTRELRILALWSSHKTFLQSLANREHAPLFSFYDGPPFATGLPHYGHILAGTIKDVIPRYKTMQGYFVPRRFGWDCHGLPVENEIEKAQQLSGAPAIETFGVGRFNEECRKIVLRYAEQWKATVTRMGRWVDFDQTYHTMDLSFMESVWWVFSQLFAKGLVYEGFKVMPFSAKLGTPLSQFEANLNYRDVDDPSLTVAFPLKGQPEVAFLAWTTTPWTLPSNLALAVGPKIPYVRVRDTKTGRSYILARDRLSQYFKDSSQCVVEETFLGEKLVNSGYEPIFPYFARKRELSAFRVLLDDAVSTEDGTGIVHMAPAFGEVDFFACMRAGIELVCPVDHNGKFTDEVPDFAGLFVKDADKEIIRRLKEKGRVFHHGQIRHRYPFCWRSDTPLIYRAVHTWFVAVEKLKERLLTHNTEIHWVPDHIKYGRFGKWLEGARDWAISRNRYWGTPIPIWRSTEGELFVIGSIAELEQRTGKKITDLHRHYIDDLVLTEGGKKFTRIPEVFDCWFESGSMPYAQNHYPFENQKETLASFPADFIAEGLDQTRGWFYTLHILATALFDQIAFKNVIVNGIILAENGAKMSKRLKNYPEPEKVFSEYGADAVRLFLLSSPVVNAHDLRFSESGVEQVLRQVLIPLWNSFVFLSTYASIYQWNPETQLEQPNSDIDRWLYSILHKLILTVTSAMDRYELSEAVAPFVRFIDQLTNWYIRRSRSRFWAEEDSADRRSAFSTLYQVLFSLTQLGAPFLPFLSEAIYQQLKTAQNHQSVHLCDFPKYNLGFRLPSLEEEMSLVQQIVSMGHALRKEHKLKVRQPLRLAHLISSDLNAIAIIKRQQQLIADELNVHTITTSTDESQVVTLNCKPNFRILGKKAGSKMRAVQAQIERLHPEQIAKLANGQSLPLQVEGEELILTAEDVEISRQVQAGLVASTADGITLVLDTALDEELLTEGLVRELINKINTMRREGGFAVTDRIEVALQTSPRVQEAFRQNEGLICREVLAVRVTFTGCTGTEWDLNGESAVIAIAKA